MTEWMPTLAPGTILDTADEPWDDGKHDWYVAAERFAVDNLGHGGAKRKCLVIGSPINEVRTLASNGWRVTHLDIRRHLGSVVGDATAMEFPSETFDAVSSTCVLCHVGLGRYGDPVKPNGDVLMMGEIARVLKPGGVAVLMVGPMVPVAALSESAIYGNVHRFYRLADVLKLANDAGMGCENAAAWLGGKWFDPDEVEGRKPDLSGGSVEYGYLSVVLRKRIK